MDTLPSKEELSNQLEEAIQKQNQLRLEHAAALVMPHRPIGDILAEIAKIDSDIEKLKEQLQIIEEMSKDEIELTVDRDHLRRRAFFWARKLRLYDRMVYQQRNELLNLLDNSRAEINLLLSYLDNSAIPIFSLDSQASNWDITSLGESMWSIYELLQNS